GGVVPGGEGTDADEAAAVAGDDGGVGALGRVGPTQAAHPSRVLAERLLERGDLAGRAAGVGVGAPEVVGGGLVAHDPQLDRVAAADPLGGGEGLGEVVP